MCINGEDEKRYGAKKKDSQKEVYDSQAVWGSRRVMISEHWVY